MLHLSKTIVQTTCLFKKSQQSLMVFKTHLPIATLIIHSQRVISRHRFTSSLVLDWVICLTILAASTPKTLARNRINNRMVKTQVNAQVSQAEVVLIEFHNLQSSTVQQETWTRWCVSKVPKIRSLSMETHKLKMCHPITLSSSKLKDSLLWIKQMEQRDNRSKCTQIYKLQW